MFVKEEIELYKNEILEILKFFKSNFSVFNPILLWRKGEINRTGCIDREGKIKYSFHGSGVTIEKQSLIISFDFYEDEISLDKFKFKIYLETKFNKELEESDLKDVSNGILLINLKTDL